MALLGLTGLLVMGFVAGRALTNSIADADDPGTVDTRDRAAAPDALEATLEAEGAAAPFRGEINGITLGASDGPLPLCSDHTIKYDPTILEGTKFDLHLDAFHERVTVLDGVRIGVCGDDGRIMWVVARAEVAAGNGVNGDAGLLQISRWESVRWYEQEFLEDRVVAGEVGGLPAVLADRGDSGFGNAAVIVVDANIDGSTMLISTNVDIGLLTEIAGGIYR